MSRKKNSECIPHDLKFPHGLPHIGPTNTKPVSWPDGKIHEVPTVRPSRFNEFMHKSEKAKGGK